MSNTRIKVCMDIGNIRKGGSSTPQTVESHRSGIHSCEEEVGDPRHGSIPPSTTYVDRKGTTPDSRVPHKERKSGLFPCPSRDEDLKTFQGLTSTLDRVSTTQTLCGLLPSSPVGHYDDDYGDDGTIV